MAATLIQKRGRVLRSLTKAATFAENINNQTDTEEIELRLQKCDSWWEEFYNIEDELLLKPDQTSKADEFEAKFFTTQTAMTRELKKRKPIVPVNNDDLNTTIANMCSQQRLYFDSLQNRTLTQNNEIKLPRMNIPPFNGEYTQWPSFKDMFEATVHKNESLSRVHKFQLLKGLLQGSAARLINHFLITDASYEEAWDKLRQRYDKKRTIVSTIIKTFFDQPAIHFASPKSLRDLTETSDELLRGLKALGPECESRNPWILHLLLNKMDDETKQQWSLHSVSNDMPNVYDLITFLHQRCDALESCNISRKPQQGISRTSYVVTTNLECMFCNKPHPLHKCFKFLRCSMESRKSFITKHELCKNCLKVGHAALNCLSTNTCFKCKAKHHTILHDDTSGFHKATINTITASKAINNDSSSPGTSIHSDTQTCAATMVTVGRNKRAILPTIVMSTKDLLGNTHTVRALLDSGSESTFITEALTKKLGLKRKHACINISGLSSVSAGRTKGQVNVKLSSRHDTNKFIVVEALILYELTNYLPSQATNLQEYNMSKHEGICLADPNFYEPNPIDMILGIDVFYEVVNERRILLQPNLQLLDSLFGWVVAGYSEQTSNSSTECCHLIQKTSEDIVQTLQRFWEVEECAIETPTKIDECEEHFANTYQKSNGRYIVQLPFKENLEQLGSSLKQAQMRMIAMERKFQKDAILKSEYIRFMREYEQLGHMSRIPDKDVLSEYNQYYLPHHAVFKQTSTSKKLRVVFDGSCKSNSGLSLNDVLKTGPTIQEDLFSILSRFRRHKIAVVSDVEKMYRQVRVHPNHQEYQRIVWRENPQSKMLHYKLTTVTYGLTCSAYLAIRSLHQSAMDDSGISPKLLNIIKADFYVDDLLTGCDSVEETVVLYNDISAALSRSGFLLRKWSSNSLKFLNNIPKKQQGSDSISFSDSEACPYIKTLGICWLTKEDAFTFKIPEFSSDQLTKRKILSDCGKIFDPLGWLAPATVTFKILLQSLWLRKMEWDEALPADIEKTWCAIRNGFNDLAAIRIPRYIKHMQATHSIQYHGFCDASEKAYSAVVYARTTDPNGNTSVHLVAAKTKVSPLNQLSIPRLELCGAMLLTKLLIKISNCFVGNRTSYILDKIPTSHWQHIPTKLNPADCASRGLSSRELVQFSIWWNGPEFLQESESCWPNFQSTPIEPTRIEKRKDALVVTISCATTTQTSPIRDLIDRLSSYTAILRALSHCARFAELCLKEKAPYITSQHLQRSEHIIIKWVQQEMFKEEIHQLQTNNTVKRSSKLVSLCPIIDEYGLLRVGGRLENSNAGYSTQHPVILSKTHPLTEKLVRYLHLKYLHPSPSTMLFITRLKYWIVGAKDVIKQISSSCVQCIRTRPRLCEQRMGNLPTPRVTFTRAFINVGVDYAGPITISSKRGRGSKRMKAYICIFVCMATKAIHLEIVSDLTTDAFIASLRRFTGRRGLPQAIYSDNATNFVGARRKFDEFFGILASKTHDEKVAAHLGTQNIEWHTIPPSAPHFGGLWEAGVKSIKTHLRRVLGESAPTFEEMQTLLVQIEAVVNSRPLTPLNNDPTDLNILTPGHFLIGSSLLEVASQGPNDVSLKLNERWELLQNMSRGFWKRWHLEYLTTLQRRSKWQHQQQNINEGELVLIKEDNVSSLEWARGRVIKVHPGQDGKVRVVTLRTSTGELKRPVTKLCKLNIQ